MSIPRIPASYFVIRQLSMLYIYLNAINVSLVAARGYSGMMHVQQQ